MFCPRLVDKKGKKKLKMDKKSELLLFAQTSVQPSFFQCFPTFSGVFSGFNHRYRLFPVFILDATIGMTFLRLFLMVAIVIANDHRQRSFAQVYSGR